MTLALATRGYLCSGRGRGRKFGKGPTITGIDEQKPSIKGAATAKTPTPTIVGAGVPGPKITKSTAPTPPPAGSKPVITGAGVMKPGGKGKT
jgi:hypothetical protein